MCIDASFFRGSYLKRQWLLREEHCLHNCNSAIPHYCAQDNIYRQSRMHSFSMCMKDMASAIQGRNLLLESNKARRVPGRNGACWLCCQDWWASKILTWTSMLSRAMGYPWQCTLLESQTTEPLQPPAKTTPIRALPLRDHVPCREWTFASPP